MEVSGLGGRQVQRKLRGLADAWLADTRSGKIHVSSATFGKVPEFQKVGLRMSRPLLECSETDVYT